MSGAVLTFSVLAVVFGYTQQISTPRTRAARRRLSKERSMPDFVPIDDYVTDESFRGRAVRRALAMGHRGALSTFRPGDDEQFWLLDFHYPVA